jgi:hypothetical protein
MTPTSASGRFTHDFPALLKRAKRFDEELTSDLVRSGGLKYAALAITPTGKRSGHTSS